MAGLASARWLWWLEEAGVKRSGPGVELVDADGGTAPECSPGSTLEGTLVAPEEMLPFD